MSRIEIPIGDLNLNVPEIWDNWLLLSCGDYAVGHYNAMTIGWGFFGASWEKPQAVVMVRKHRYTFEFMEKYPDFTISAFQSDNQAYKDALTILGTKSGRDTDKMTTCGLTAIASKSVASPSFKEACLTLECKKDYFTDLSAGTIVSDYIRSHYSNDNDVHRLYIGQIVRAFSNMLNA